MKTTFYLSIASILMLSTLFVSCSEDEKQGDTTKPVINLIAPAEGAVLAVGTHIHFDMQLEDDVMLGSYKVEIHNNFDGHEHTKSDAVSVTGDTTPFAYNNSWDVSGKREAKIHHHEIEIPANATHGNYHLMVYCTDAAGNESYVARNIVLAKEGETGEH